MRCRLNGGTGCSRLRAASLGLLLWSESWREGQADSREGLVRVWPVQCCSIRGRVTGVVWTRLVCEICL